MSNRSEAARKAAETRRRRKAEAAAVFARRSQSSRKGWVTRRAREAYKKVTTPGAPRSARPPVTPKQHARAWAVYDWRHVNRGDELGYATSLMDAESVAEAAAPDGEELENVEKGYGPPDSVLAFAAGAARRPRAYLAHFRPLPPDEEPEEEADEWEIGFEYRGADRGSAVDVNIRIAREDGAAFGPREAGRVLKEFRDNLGRESHNAIPDGYLMAFIDWRRPRWGTEWQGGDDDTQHLTAFHAPMYTQAADNSAWKILPHGDVRLGSIKR